MLSGVILKQNTREMVGFKQTLLVGCLQISTLLVLTLVALTQTLFNCIVAPGMQSVVFMQNRATVHAVPRTVLYCFSRPTHTRSKPGCDADLFWFCCPGFLRFTNACSNKLSVFAGYLIVYGSRHLTPACKHSSSFLQTQALFFCLKCHAKVLLAFHPLK